MARLTNRVTKVTVNVDDAKVARLGPDWVPAEKPAPKKRTAKTKK